jgi:hypothetical protein
MWLLKHSVTMAPTYPEGRHEDVFELVGDGDEQGLAAGDQGESSRHVAHHVVGGRAHTILLRVQRKVLHNAQHNHVQSPAQRTIQSCEKRIKGFNVFTVFYCL